MGLKLDVKIGQTIDMPGVGQITVIEKPGKRIRLDFNVPREQIVRLIDGDQRTADAGLSN